MFQDRDYYGASQSLHDKLTARNDPRDDVFFTPYPNTGSEIIFAPNGTANQVQGYYSISAISTVTAPTYLLSYHEIEFLKAEAYARLNNLSAAGEALENAITAAFRKVNIGLTADDPYTIFITDLGAIDGITEDNGPFVLHINPATFNITCETKTLSSDYYGYGAVTYSGYGVFSSCDGAYSLYIDISVGAYGSQGVYLFQLTGKP